MSQTLEHYDPYQTPTPYDVLGVKKGVRATAKEIGKAYNKSLRKARHLKDSEQRAAKMAELEWAKERLQRPEDRVLVDFFILADDLFADLCVSCGDRLAAAPLPTQEAIGPLLSSQKYDDLVPRPLKQFLGEFQLVDDLAWFDDDDAENPQLPLCVVDF
jgi:hypothetical protein